MQGYTFLQVADITLEGEWLPIGLNPDGVQPNASNFYTAADPFRGTYDGQGYTISNLVVNMPETNGVGLFGCCYKGLLLKILVSKPAIFLTATTWPVPAATIITNTTQPN
jgi:hypothetical protein